MTFVVIAMLTTEVLVIDIISPSILLEECAFNSEGAFSFSVRLNVSRLPLLLLLKLEPLSLKNSLNHSADGNFGSLRPERTKGVCPQYLLLEL